jgi:hypothetical protein
MQGGIHMHQNPNPTTADMVKAVKDALWQITPLAPVTAPVDLTPAQELDWLWHAGTVAVSC